MRVKVGCCGFPKGMRRYFETFSVVEIQQTFYKPPKIETLNMWRELAGDKFEFTIKAFQAITHPPTSPTWRKAGIKVDPNKLEKYGYLKPTEENFEAWEATLKAAKALKAKIIVVQTPPTFGFNRENVKRIYDFFNSIDRRGFHIVWEPRGSWLEVPEETSKIMEDLNLIHGVDLLRYDPMSRLEILYCRLHGLGGRSVNYKYKYSMEDLQSLKAKLELLSTRYEVGYVMFNNVYMWDDSLKFREICSGSEALECS